MAPQKSDACLFLKPFTFWVYALPLSFQIHILFRTGILFLHISTAQYYSSRWVFFFASLVCLLLSSSIAWEYDHYAEYKYI